MRFKNAIWRDMYLWDNNLNKDHKRNTTEEDRKQEDAREKRLHRFFKKETGYQHRYLDPIGFDEEFFNWLTTTVEEEVKPYLNRLVGFERYPPL